MRNYYVYNFTWKIQKRVHHIHSVYPPRENTDEELCAATTVWATPILPKRKALCTASMLTLRMTPLLQMGEVGLLGRRQLPDANLRISNRHVDITLVAADRTQGIVRHQNGVALCRANEKNWIFLGRHATFVLRDKDRLCLHVMSRPGHATRRSLPIISTQIRADAVVAFQAAQA